MITISMQGYTEGTRQESMARKTADGNNTTKLVNTIKNIYKALSSRVKRKNLAPSAETQLAPPATIQPAKPYESYTLEEKGKIYKELLDNIVRKAYPENNNGEDEGDDGEDSHKAKDYFRLDFNDPIVCGPFMKYGFLESGEPLTPTVIRNLIKDMEQDDTCFKMGKVYKEKNGYIPYLMTNKDGIVLRDAIPLNDSYGDADSLSLASNPN